MEEQNWKKTARKVQKDPLPRRTGIISSPGNTRHTFPALFQLANKSGLCNRLRGWAGIGALADIFNLSFVIHWQRNPVCACDFNNVFIPDSCAVMTSQRDRSKFNLLKQFSAGWATHNTEVYRGIMDVPEAEFWDAARKRTQALKLRPEHSDVLDAFMETVPANAIGLHVRRTDMHERHVADPPMYAALDKVVEQDPDATFLLCADNPRSIDAIRKRYDGRVYWRDQHMTKQRKRRHRATSQIDAAIDLYALARTTRIIGTRCSSFSGYAAFLGGIPLQPV